MYIDKNQAKIKEAKQKRNLILNVIQQLKEKGFNFSDCIYCDAKQTHILLCVLAILSF